MDATGNKGIATRNKKLLGAPGLTARSKDATSVFAALSDSDVGVMVKIPCHGGCVGALPCRFVSNSMRRHREE